MPTFISIIDCFFLSDVCSFALDGNLPPRGTPLGKRFAILIAFGVLFFSLRLECYCIDCPKTKHSMAPLRDDAGDLPFVLTPPLIVSLPTCCVEDSLFKRKSPDLRA